MGTIHDGHSAPLFGSAPGRPTLRPAPPPSGSDVPPLLSQEPALPPGCVAADMLSRLVFRPLDRVSYETTTHKRSPPQQHALLVL